jgi:hypothetical protein
VHPTTKKQVYSKESTINSYAWYLQAIPIKFSCATFQKNLQNTSHFVTLFSAHGDVVVVFSIFHIVIFRKTKNKEEKEKKKGTPPWYVKVGGHPIESVSHGLRKEKWGGVPSFIKESKCANLSKNLLSMEDSKNPIASR